MSSNQQHQQCIYLDHAATTPVAEEAVNCMMPFLTDHFGNPSSSHAFGDKPKAAIEQARDDIERFFITGVSATESFQRQGDLIFTGCGTEADNLAIRLALAGVKLDEKPHIVTTNVEHPAVSQCLQKLSANGDIDVTFVPIREGCGYVDPTDVLNAIVPGRTCLVTVMYVNNEIGTINPVKQICQMIKDSDNNKNIPVHTDAAQGFGKIPPQTLYDDLSLVDMVTVVGHKVGVPKGVGGLWIRKGTGSLDKIPSDGGMILVGGGQEGGLRGGTENVPYIAALGGMAKYLYSDKKLAEQKVRDVQKKREAIISGLRSRLGHDNVRINGEPENASETFDDEIWNKQWRCVPSIISLSIRGVQSSVLLSNIRDRVAASAGSACHAGGTSVSAVLKALNIPKEFIFGTLRLSVGSDSPKMEEIDAAVEIIANEAKKQLD